MCRAEQIRTRLSIKDARTTRRPASAVCDAVGAAVRSVRSLRTSQYQSPLSDTVGEIG